MSTPTKYSAEELTDLEKEHLAAFREKCENLDGITEEQMEQAQLLRWLRARNMDIGKAYKMLELSINWRKENQLDGILERETLPQDYKYALPMAVLGVDKDGHLVILNPMGRHDYRSLVEKYGVDDCLKYQLMTMETFMEIFREKSKEYGRPVTKFVQICDLEGYGIRQLTSNACRELIFRGNKSIEANYPDILHSALVVNAPKVFGLFFNVLKPFLPKETLEKIEVYGPEPEKWKQAVAEKFQLDMVPEHYGGARKGSDDYCSKDEIWYYGPVPYSFFTGNKKDQEDQNMTKVIINARGSHQITLEVNIMKSTIVWRFRTDKHDIGYKILHRKNDQEQVLLPINRAQSHKKLQEGTQLCKEEGFYVFVFDNTHSMYRSKTVYYNVSVKESE